MAEEDLVTFFRSKILFVKLPQEHPVETLGILQSSIELNVFSIEVVGRALALYRGVWNASMALQVEEVNRGLIFIAAEATKIDFWYEMLVLVRRHESLKRIT